jgi:hypothetical protein
VSASLEVGDVKTLTWSTTAGATVVLTITLPDGTTSTPAVTAVGGDFTASYVATQNGLHGFRWVATGAATAAESGTFQVGGILSLADAKLQLNKTSNTDDVELQSYIDAATFAVEWYSGSVLPVTRTEWCIPNGSEILLRRMPVASVVSVTEYQGATPFVYTAISDPTAAGSYTYLFERELGRITRLGSGGWDFPFWGRRVKVVYVSGYPVMPANFVLAAKIIVQHLWETQNATLHAKGIPQLDTEAVTFIPGINQSVPTRALEMLPKRETMIG